MPEGQSTLPTIQRIFDLCAAALLEDERVTIAEDLARRCAEVMIDELVDSAVLMPADRWDEDCHRCEQAIRLHLVDGSCPPAPPAWGDWTEPDPAVVDELTRWGTHGADRVAIEAMADLSITGHERTRREVHAAIRLLLANGLAQPTLPVDEVMIYMDPPVS